MVSTLLHLCCAPCSITCIEDLQGEGLTPVGYWNNPNIHPFTEYRQRRDTVTEYAKTIGLDLISDGEYGLRPFLAATAGNPEHRCPFCYRARLEPAARYAAEHGFETFTTTLLVSPYQDHDLLCKVGAEMGAEYGVTFLPRDFRPRFREGQQRARALGLYMQKYCGCIFSEEDRYRKAK